MLAYELYGLSEEEIAVVEERDHSSGTIDYLSNHQVHAVEPARFGKGGK